MANEVAFKVRFEFTFQLCQGNYVGLELPTTYKK